MRLILLGKPGSGKGTQGKRLAARAGIPIISTGDLIRNSIAQGTDLGRRFKEYLNKGLLVPDDLVVAMVRERLAQPDTAKGFLLDGYPRTGPQAEALDRMLTDLGRPLSAAVYIVVPDEALIERAVGRRYCPQDGSTYHVKFAPPKVTGRCNQCGGSLEQRSDDREEVVLARIQEYRDKTSPLIEFYNSRGLLREVNGVGTPDEVGGRIDKALPGIR